MRLRGALFAAALLAAAPALAQERGGEKIDWAKRLDALFEVLQREEEEFAKATAAAPPGPDGTPAMPDMSKHPGRKRLPEFLEIARGAKGSDAGVKAAHWILTRGSGLPGGEGLEKEAFRLLGLSLKAGFGFNYLAIDRELDPIRDDPRFKQVVDDARLRQPGGVN